MSFFRTKTPAKTNSPKKANAKVQADQQTTNLLNTLLGPILVDQTEFYQSKGAIDRSDMQAVWVWLVRDSKENLAQEASRALANPDAQHSISNLAAKIAKLIRAGIEAADKNPEIARRIQIQLGGKEVFDQLGHIEHAFRHQQLLAKSVAFGQAINGVRDENSLKLALQTFPVDDQIVSSFMMHAALGQVQNPNRLIGVVLELSDAKNQRAITAAGFSPVIEALIAHAQNQIPYFSDTYTRFVDMDLVCQSLDRYHRLVRALTSITENDKNSSWAYAVSSIIRQMSQLIEPRLLKVDADIRQSMRKPRSGPDRLDADLLFDALNGLYLLAAVREAVDALALNSVVNDLWNDIGKALEILISRNLETFRQEPDNGIVAQRLNTGIKMAEIRFNPEYADIMARARDSATKRAIA